MDELLHSDKILIFKCKFQMPLAMHRQRTKRVTLTAKKWWLFTRCSTAKIAIGPPHIPTCCAQLGKKGDNPPTIHFRLSTIINIVFEYSINSWMKNRTYRPAEWKGRAEATGSDRFSIFTFARQCSRRADDLPMPIHFHFRLRLRLVATKTTKCRGWWVHTPQPAFGCTATIFR